MSSFVFASPEAFATAAQDLTAIGSAIESAHRATALSTTQVAAAAQDEVSAAIATVFSGYAQGYHTLAGQAAAFHDQFVDTLAGNAGAYAATEAANAARTAPTDVARTLRTDVVATEQTLAGDAASMGRGIPIITAEGGDGPHRFFQGFFNNIGNIFKPGTYRPQRTPIHHNNF